MRSSLFLIMLSIGFTLSVSGSAAGTRDPSKECAPGNWLEVGCRYSRGECFNSCGDHRYCAVVDEQKCPTDLMPSEVACYCYQGNQRN